MYKLNKSKFSDRIKILTCAILTAISTGIAVSVFLFVLDKITLIKWHNNFLLYLLPIGGLLIAYLYKTISTLSEAGNNLLISAILSNKSKIPSAMMPLVILTTWLTHLLGGSAGREGTAVQAGGSIAATFLKAFKVDTKYTGLLITAGLAAGFGAVFGTPITAGVFAIEVIASGKYFYKYLPLAIIAAIIADQTVTFFSINHTHYTIGKNYLPQLSALQIIYIALASALFGLTALAFTHTTHTIKQTLNKYITNKYSQILTGGIVLVLLYTLLNLENYIGLGVNKDINNGIAIASAFSKQMPYNSWLIKLLLTAITIGTGYKGGEVTPLFFIGAMLGNTLAIHLGLPIDLLAGLGFITVFSSATNTPIAGILLGIELFGIEYLPLYILSSTIGFFTSGNTSIYSAQLLHRNKYLLFKKTQNNTIELL